MLQMVLGAGVLSYRASDLWRLGWVRAGCEVGLVAVASANLPLTDLTVCLQQSHEGKALVRATRGTLQTCDLTLLHSGGETG